MAYFPLPVLPAERPDPSHPDRPHDHCGVFGIFNHPQASLLTYYGLHALQHRGQEGAGIVTAAFDPARNKVVTHIHKGIGLVADVFRDETIFERLIGSSAVGHNRYSTTGDGRTLANVQPFSVVYRGGTLALAHNGNLTNTRELRHRLIHDGVLFASSTDSEALLHLIARSRASEPIEQIAEALRQVTGAYSLVILTDHAVFAASDPNGFKPLALGRIPAAASGGAADSYLVASETCAFDIIGAEFVREIGPGEIIQIDLDGCTSGQFRTLQLPRLGREARCIFEYVYFARPDSRIFGVNVDMVRRKLGKNLAREHAVEPDAGDPYVTVIAVPDSSNTATLGFTTESNKLGVRARFELGLIRNHYVGRTFIQPGQAVRELKARVKYNPVRGVLKGRKVVVIDDSIVRGTTSKLLIKLIREAGPTSIHFRVTSPPIQFPCFYGMDFPQRDELIANRFDRDVGRIADEIGVDSLAYLSLDGMLAAVPPEQRDGCCTACMSGQYPVPIEPGTAKNVDD